MATHDLFDLKGRCSIVTGAAMGLGKAMAEGLASVGSDIVVADLDEAAADRTAAELRRFGTRVETVRTDVADPDDAVRLARAVESAFGRIDVLVNNAGICAHEKAEDMRLEDWNRVLAVNLTGVFLVSQAVGRVMIRQRRGSIVNIASMSGLIVNTPQCQCGYNASKAGVIQLTRTLAAEWAPHGVRVNAIAPGYMKTELTRPFFESPGDETRRWLSMTPMGRPGEPEELKGIAIYLASDASSFATGGVFTVDGGYTAW